jgi:hypothetical protein
LSNLKKLHHHAGRRRNPPATSAHKMVETVPTHRIFWGWNRKVAAVTKGSKVLTSKERYKTNPTEPDITVDFPGDVTPAQAVRLLENVKEAICVGGWPDALDKTGPMWTDLEVRRRGLVDRSPEGLVSDRGSHRPGKYSRRKVTKRL